MYPDKSEKSMDIVLVIYFDSNEDIEYVSCYSKGNLSKKKDLK